MRKSDKKLSAPPDFQQPWYKPDLPNVIDKIRKSKEQNKTTKTFSIENILQIREDFESYVKPLPIVKIWRRKLKSVIVYRVETIFKVGDQDEAWILPYEIVKIQRRKVREEVTIDELDNF